MAAIACAWFRKNVFEPCDGDPPCTMYFETVDWATSKPSISSSPWIRDAPHFGFSLLIRRMRSRNSRAIFGRPARSRDFQRQNAVKPARCQRECRIANIVRDPAMILPYDATPKPDGIFGKD